MLKIKIQKLYAWSIVLESMVFFVVSPQSLTGVGANISRMLQIVVLFSLLIRLTIVGKISFRFSTFTRSRYSLFVLYFCMAVMSGAIGLFMGGYSLNSVSDVRSISSFASLINAPYFRPTFEYVILAYYIGYFAVLPSIILKKEEDIKYFFRVFFFMFNISLFIGLIGVFLVWRYRINIVGRHMYEWYTGGPVSSGLRFHGLFGEPRDAFVLLGLGAAFYYLKSIVFNKRQSKCYYALLLICALLAQSVSGMVGIAIFIMIYLVIMCLDLNLNHFMKAILLVSVLGVVFYGGIVNSPRILMVVNLIYEGLGGMYRERIIPNVLNGQMCNIYPMFWIVDELSQFNPIPMLLGGGLGSPSFVTSSYGLGGYLNNPHAGIIRVIVETGIIGCFLYISAFYIPVKRMVRKLPHRIRNNIILFLILVLSLSLGHRSAANFIFLGVLFAAFNISTELNFTKCEDSRCQ